MGSRLLAALMFAAAPLAAQMPTEADILAAIERGLSAKSVESAEGSSGTFMALGMGFHVTVSGPLNRVASAAAANARKYLPFTRDSVTEGMLRPTAVVTVHPKTPEIISGRMQVTPPATHVVLQARQPEGAPVVQPTEMVPVPAAWNNPMGAQYESAGALVVFPLEAIPTGEFDVVIVTSAKEYRARIRPQRGPPIR